ncbi:MAG: 16S rRNA (guanine(527)-N(7))-methyltransferase RsmG [Cytophagales bacterium]|nr:16S rRNA (guanine(527)-N(7))-methyltransferase RsmG [Cytophagales bacterium]
MELIKSYFPNLTEKQIRQFEKLGEVYPEWNDKINVISRKDIQELYTRHILHSLAIAKVQEFKPGSAVLDVGTGGGFPGIPLAVLFPETSFYLIDSIGKKIKVVQGVADAIGLENVRAEQIRAEQVKEKFDFVVSRAVTRLKPFCQWIKTNFKKESVHDRPNGILYLKGGDLEEELREARKKHELYEIKSFFKEDFFETKKVVYVPVDVKSK